MTVAAALAAATLRRSAGTSGDPCVAPGVSGKRQCKSAVQLPECAAHAVGCRMKGH